jgi:cytochrome c nitrite reductase small subunit
MKNEVSGKRLRMRANNHILILTATLIGLVAGVGIFTFVYARGASYMTDNPAACANCHVMRDQYESWMKGSHRKAAVCNDCHTPPGFVPKYGTKAMNGFFHSWAFTTGWFPDDIRITERNYRVANQACMKCHEQITSGIRSVRGHREDVACITCHRQAGHM